MNQALQKSFTPIWNTLQITLLRTENPARNTSEDQGTQESQPFSSSDSSTRCISSSSIMLGTLQEIAVSKGETYSEPNWWGMEKYDTSRASCGTYLTRPLQIVRGPSGSPTSTSSTYKESASGCFQAFRIFPTRMSNKSRSAPTSTASAEEEELFSAGGSTDTEDGEGDTKVVNLFRLPDELRATWCWWGYTELEEMKSEREWKACDGREQTLAWLTAQTLVGAANKSEEETLIIVGERDRVAPASAIAAALAARIHETFQKRWNALNWSSTGCSQQ